MDSEATSARCLSGRTKLFQGIRMKLGLRTFISVWLVLLVFPVARVGGAISNTARLEGELGVLLVAHGAGKDWNSAIHELAERLAVSYPVEVAFLMGEEAQTSSFQAAATRLAKSGVDRIVVVPLMVSSHGVHTRQIRYLAGVIDSLSIPQRDALAAMGQSRPELGIELSVTSALDDAPELAEALAERAKSIASAPRQQGLFLVAHGPSDAEDATRWMKNLRLIANGVKYDVGFADVRVGLLQDDAPKEVRAEAVRRIREIIELQHRATNQPVIVVPVLVSRGRINNDKIPRDLAGLLIKYTGAPLLPHPALERWVLREVAADRVVTTGAGS